MGAGFIHSGHPQEGSEEEILGERGGQWEKGGVPFWSCPQEESYVGNPPPPMCC